VKDMIKSFKEIIERAREIGPKNLAVAVAQDSDVLNAVNNAYRMGIVNGILVGNEREIRSIAEENDIDLSNFEILDVEDKVEACNEAAKLVRDGKAEMLMKGFVDTSIILKAVLNKEHKLTGEGILSHVGVLKVEGFDKLFVMSDAAMNIAPTLEEKVFIVRNAVKVARALGIDNPKVAILSCVEKVNPKIQSTVDAAKLVEMNKNGEITGCIIGGPFALDNAVSIEAAKHKGINDPVAGNADVLITPNLESGNMLNKSMEYFARAEKAGIIMGAKAPIVLTSRASSEESKLNSIALAVLSAC